MHFKLLTAIALSTAVSTAAYAGSGCNYGTDSGMQKVTLIPAVMKHSFSSRDFQTREPMLTEAKAMYAMSHGSSNHGTASGKMSGPDIVDTAISAGSFNTLVEALKAGGLVETLKGEGPFTVFAPTDDAFAKLPDGTLQSLLADKQKLVKVLTYHVVPGKVMSTDLPGVKTIKTVEGSTIEVADLQVASADIRTSNGVIHVVDEVLIPQM